MRDTKNSAGPWVLHKVKNDSGHIKHLCPVDTDGFSVLTVVECDGIKFAAVYSDEDAQLIAAAPDLLDALKSILGANAIPSTACKERAAYEKARAAIAKATGEQQ